MDDFEDLVSFLTPREEDSEIKSYQNTTGVPCPVCEASFDDLVVCKDPPTSLNLTMTLDLCVDTQDDRIVLFTHKKDG